MAVHPSRLIGGTVSSADYNTEYAATAAGSVAREIPGKPGYHVNAAGQVWCGIAMGRGDRRRSAAKEWRPMTYRMYDGFWMVCLSGRRETGAVGVRYLVAAALLPAVEGKPFLGLVDTGRRHDHGLPNLVWKSRIESNENARKALVGYHRGRRVLTEDQVVRARQAVRAGATIPQVAKAVGGDLHTLRAAVMGKTFADLDHIERPVRRQDIKKVHIGRPKPVLLHLADVSRLVKLCDFKVSAAVRQMLGSEVETETIRLYQAAIREANKVG